MSSPGIGASLAWMPLTRRFLGGLAPGLGDFFFVQREVVTFGTIAKLVRRRGPSTKVGAGNQATVPVVAGLR